MHEVSLMEELVDLIVSEARVRSFAQVRMVRLAVGALSCADADALRFCFPAVTAGTIAEHARLEIDAVPGTGWCDACRRLVALDERYTPCPDCGATGLAVRGGAELDVVELEVI